MTVIEMLTFVVLCNQTALQIGFVPQDLALECMKVRESLIQEVADGDYNKYREWYKTNSKIVLEELEAKNKV